jgi:hypothetical protein
VAWNSYFSRCNNTWRNIAAIYLWLIACLGINARLSCYKMQHCGTTRPRPPSLPTLTMHSHFIWYSWYSVVFCFFFIVYFAALLGSRECSEEGRVIKECWFGKNLERSGRSLICALSFTFVGRDWGRVRKSSVGIAVVRNVSGGRHLPNTSQQHYRYPNLSDNTETWSWSKYHPILCYGHKGVNL